MPGGDKTGPVGQGPMTGRASGYCADSHQPGMMSQFMGRWFGGRGQGRGGGYGRGHRHGFCVTGMPGWQRAAWGLMAWGGQGPDPRVKQDDPAPTPAQELAWLKQQADSLESELHNVQSRIVELNKSESK